jgi:hypothetical protein
MGCLIVCMRAPLGVTVKRHIVAIVNHLLHKPRKRHHFLPPVVVHFADLAFAAKRSVYIPRGVRAGVDRDRDQTPPGKLGNALPHMLDASPPMTRVGLRVDVHDQIFFHRLDFHDHH